MARRLWTSVGSTTLTLVLLLTAAALAFVGALYAGPNFASVGALNEQRVQDWLSTFFAEQWTFMWWLPLFFIVMALLGANAAVCLCTRLGLLWRVRKDSPRRQWLLAVIPSVIHGLFWIVLLGHLLTFTLARFERLSLGAGVSVASRQLGVAFEVRDVADAYFPAGSLLAGRIAQTTVRLADPTGTELSISHLSPRTYDGQRLLLDRVKKPRGNPEALTVQAKQKENCNKAPVYNTSEQAGLGALELLVIDDPGRWLIFPAFVLILVLMALYFVALGASSRGKASSVKRTPSQPAMPRSGWP